MNLKVVGSSPTVGKIFLFCIISLFFRSSAEPIEMNSSMICIRGNRCIERMVIWKKYGNTTTT